MKLSDRMEKIVNMCGRQNVWADIGCDHGRVSCELVLRQKAEKVIAADVSELSLYKAKDLSASLGLADKVDCRHGDGLKVLDIGEAQGAVIAGMGTPLIEKIINESRETATALNELVVSPNNYPDRLRRWFVKNRFEIVCERIAEDDNRFYPVIKLNLSKTEELSEKEAFCGRNMIKDNTYKRYIEWLINRETKIIQSINEGGGDAAEHIRLRTLYEEEKYGND